MSETNNTGPDYGASAQPDYQMANFIQLAHIYDVLMALLMEQNPETGTAILELHHQGNIIGPNPAWNGEFLTNLANSEYTSADASGDDQEKATAENN